MIVGRYPTMYSPPISGMLLIDCWNVTEQPIPTKQNINYFYQNILRTVDTLNIECVINAMTRSDTQTLDTTLESIATKCRYSTQWLDEFIKITQSTQIKHWYVVGQSWQMCVHNNDIGLNNLAKSLDLNFYSDLKSFLKINGTVVEHNDFVNDELSWKFVPRFGYHLTQGVS
jgi:hypothetical protein